MLNFNFWEWDSESLVVWIRISDLYYWPLKSEQLVNGEVNVLLLHYKRISFVFLIIFYQKISLGVYSLDFKYNY